MALAQKIMDRLLDLSTQLYTYDPDLGSAGGVSSSSRAAQALESAGAHLFLFLITVMLLGCVVTPRRIHSSSQHPFPLFSFLRNNALV